MEGSGGVRLRVALFMPPGAARGSVIVHPGRTEFIEAYGEVVADWRARGFAVLVHDWRGQGLSDRLLADPLRCHARGWRPFVADHRRILAAFADRLPLPWIGLGHSMGGALLAQALVEEAVDGEARYAGAIITAPMLGLRTGRHPPWTVAAAAVVRTALGRGSSLPLHIPERQHVSFAANVLTHDPERYARTRSLIEAHAGLRLGGPTWGWLVFAFAVAAQALRPGGAERVETPVLMLLAGEDRLLRNAPSRLWGRRAPGARVVTLDAAWHELLMEADLVRRHAWTEMDAFVDRLVPALAARPSVDAAG